MLRLGVPVPAAADRSARRALLRSRLGLHDRVFVLATLGRLVRRKGARWFVLEVMPRLPEHVHYVLAGDGPERSEIAQAARSSGVTARVHLLGPVDEDTRGLVLGGSDLFVQPNIPVEGDIEGFGLVVVEAAMMGTPVVAARLEGIEDAVSDGETGMLVPPGDTAAWVDAVQALVQDPAGTVCMGDRFARRAAELYSEAQMGSALLEILSPTHDDART